ncbi:MAG TPA: FtsQ-type POTRA domain-containing protein [Burkholderiales bacterium]
MEMTDTKRVGTVLRLIVALAVFVAFAYAVDWALRAENFPVQSVRFEGPFRRVTQQQLERAALDALRGNFFLVDLGAVQRRVEALPWVQSASVRRLFPREVAIVFREQRLAARWSGDAWVNVQGDVVRVAGDDLPADLPRLDGPEGTSAQVFRAYHEFRAGVAPLDLRLVGVSLSARRSWRLELQAPEGPRSFVIVVDHDQPFARLERFVRAYGGAVAPQADRIGQVDLRYTNGFAVQWNSQGAPPRVAHSAATHNEG